MSEHYIINKFVDFYKYCSTCKHYEKRMDEDPCDECLENPVNLHSQKPVKYEAVKNVKKSAEK